MKASQSTESEDNESSMESQNPFSILGIEEETQEEHEEVTLCTVCQEYTSQSVTMPTKTMCMHCVANDLQAEAQRAREDIEAERETQQAEQEPSETDQDLASRLQREELSNSGSTMQQLESFMQELEKVAKEIESDKAQSSSDQDQELQRSPAESMKKASIGIRKSNEKLSKAMSSILRHKADTIGLSIRSDGFVPVRELVQCKNLRHLAPSFQDIQHEVEVNKKARFSMIKLDGEWFVRADQGHSMKCVKSEDLLEVLHKDSDNLPEWVVHGTYLVNWPSIQQRDLLAGGLKGTNFRNHVHFALGLPKAGGVISGMRSDCDLYMYMNVRTALAKGLPLFRSNNGVILTPGIHGKVPLEFIGSVIKKSDGKELWTNVHPFDEGTAQDSRNTLQTKGKQGSSRVGGSSSSSTTQSKTIRNPVPLFLKPKLLIDMMQQRRKLFRVGRNHREKQKGHRVPRVPMK